MSKWITIESPDDLHKIPQIYNTVPTTKASDRYELVHTLDILNGASALGWEPRYASGVGDNPYGFHAIKMEHPEYKTEDGDNVQMVIMNSHDRTRRYSLGAGVYRFICTNGLMVPIIEFISIQQKHIGFDSLELLDQLLVTMESLQQIAPRIKEMSQMELTEDEREELATNALLLRLDEEKAATVDIDTLLHPKRPGDVGNDLWKTFNVIQEKVTHGDFEYEFENAKGLVVKRKGREINGFKTDLELNQKLFEMANQYMII